MNVIGMHFVCRDNANVTVHGDGTFTTGFWKVSASAAASVRSIALHQSKAEPSYRQGTVIRREQVLYEGAPRWRFVVRPTGQRVAWQGGGAGEKGYAWG